MTGDFDEHGISAQNLHEFPAGARPWFIHPNGGRPREEHLAASERFEDHLWGLHIAGATYQQLAERYLMTVHPIWARVQRARERKLEKELAKG